MQILIILSAGLTVALARPSVVAAPLAYTVPLAYARVVPGAPVGADGRVVDTPEVSVAKAEHAAAQANQRASLANEAVRSADALTYATPIGTPITTSLVPTAVTTSGLVSAYTIGTAAPLVQVGAAAAPVGPDGRVVDTAEVAVAKAEHAAAHVNEKISLVNEATKSSDVLAVAVPVGPAVTYNTVAY